MLGRDKICAVVAAPSAKSMRRQLRQALRQTRLSNSVSTGCPTMRKSSRFLEAGCQRGHQSHSDCHVPASEAGAATAGRSPSSLFIWPTQSAPDARGMTLKSRRRPQCPPELLDVLLGEGRQLASAHFFERCPRTCRESRRNFGGASPDAIKIAAHCDSLAESRKLLRFARTQRNIVAIPMGEVAMPARILALREGAPSPTRRLRTRRRQARFRSTK